MPPASTESQTASGKSIFKNPLFLAGAGGVVLFLILKGSGSGSSGGGGVGGATASTVQQAISDEQAQVNAALAGAKADNAAALEVNAANLREALDLDRGLTQSAIDKLRSDLETQAARNQAAATPGDSDLVAAIKSLIASMSGGAAVAPVGEAVGATPGVVIDKSGDKGGKPTLDEIYKWAQGIRPDNVNEGFSWGKLFVEWFGRLPADIPELVDWKRQLRL